MAVDKAPESSGKDSNESCHPDKMKNNSVSLALIREDGDHFLVFRLTDGTFRQARNLIPNNHDWCVSSYYRVPVETVKEVRKSEIPVSLSLDGEALGNIVFESNHIQRCEFDSSSDVKLGEFLAFFCFLYR